ncbi:MAG: tail fiber domain-containing protein [Anaerolineaceae bacterium]|nr:tail fiber domain-containing protein [Anaerolineaceae bacterium]
MKGKLFVISAFVTAMLLFFTMGMAIAQPSLSTSLGTGFTFQGQLKSSDTPYSGTCDFQFGLFDAVVSGTQIEDALVKTNITVSQGFFTVLLDYGDSAFTGNNRWLEISVRCPAGAGDYTLLSPRQWITATPYALFAKNASTAPWSGLSGVPAGFADGVDNDTTYSAGTGLTLSGTTFSANTTYLQRRVIGTCASGYAIRVVNENGTVTCEAVSGSGTSGWSLTGNAGTTPGTHYLGTSDETALEIKVNGSRVFRFEPNSTSPNLIGGYSGNNLTNEVYGAIIVGGGDISSPNSITDIFGTIGGGSGNLAGDNSGTLLDGSYATVVGGHFNRAMGQSSFVGGGYGNQSTGDTSTIAGGDSNNTSQGFAFIGGGHNNTASGLSSYVGAGYQNTAGGSSSSIGGGSYNQASGTSSTIGGGLMNIASGNYSTVIGGEDNYATGDYSFAAGRSVRANYTGCFVWGDATSANVSCSGSNQWVARASGGVTFYTSADLSTMVTVPAGGNSWATPSDRNLKENFEIIDKKALLDSLAGIPITDWNYKAQDESIRHIGPMAQDFYAAFGVGEDDTHITTIDADGVALAAIQGLYEENQELKAKVDDLEARLSALEKGFQSGNMQPAQSSTPWILVFGFCLVGGAVVISKRTGGVK